MPWCLLLNSNCHVGSLGWLSQVMPPAGCPREDLPEGFWARQHPGGGVKYPLSSLIVDTQPGIQGPLFIEGPLGALLSTQTG